MFSFMAGGAAIALVEEVSSESIAREGQKQKTAGRMAYFILELAARLRLIGLSDGAGYDCPLNQCHMADPLGLSAIHVNRVLRDLREPGMVKFHNGHVTFDDFDGLVALADFDRAYLDRDDQLLQ